MIEIEGPDGVVYEFPEGTDDATIQRAMAQAYPAPTDATVIGTANQFAVGSQSGIAGALGLPVDAVAGAMSGVGQVTGLWDPIENPFGGSASIQSVFDAVLPGAPAPQNVWERGARTIGEEVGASATMLPVGLASAAGRAAPGVMTAVEGASALGSAAGRIGAQEYLPENKWIEIAAQLAGGLLGGGTAAAGLGGGAKAPTIRPGIEDQRVRAADAYAEVRADTRILPQDSVDDMALGLSDRMDAERLNPRLQPSSSAVLDAILQDSSGPMRIEDVENLRRLTQQSVPVTAAPADARMAGIMKDEITAYLDSLDDPVADALRTGRDAHRRALAASAIQEGADKAARRAASTGSGGNEINATRQNIRSMIETPRKARSFTPDELAAMKLIVDGDTGTNLLRRLSRFAPSGGGLSSMLGIGGAMASPAIALPIIAATEGAKSLGERSTRAIVDALMQSIAPDRVLKPGDRGVQDVIRALLAGRATANDE